MLNRIVIMGRLTRDPELRKTGSGTAVANFTVAVDRDFSGKDGAEKEVDFLDCVAWRGTGEFVSKYFTKGSMIAVSGRLQLRGWTDKDGNKRKAAEIVADSVYFCGSKQDKPERKAPEYPAPAGNGYPETEAMLARYGAQGFDQQDYPLLDGDDENLPF